MANYARFFLPRGVGKLVMYSVLGCLYINKCIYSICSTSSTVHTSFLSQWFHCMYTNIIATA